MTEVGAVLSTCVAAVQPSVFGWLIAGLLWLTVLLDSLAAAMAARRGRARADALRALRQPTTAWRLVRRQPGVIGGDHVEEAVAACELRRGDLVSVPAGEVVPGDGEVVEGAASVDESGSTGESAPVLRESGRDRSAVTCGTRVLSGHLVVRITQQAGETARTGCG